MKNAIGFGENFKRIIALFRQEINLQLAVFAIAVFVMPNLIFESPFSVGDNVWVVFMFNNDYALCKFCDGSSKVYSNDRKTEAVCPFCRDGLVKSANSPIVFNGNIEFISMTQERRGSDLIITSFAYVEGEYSEYSFAFKDIFFTKEEANLNLSERLNEVK